MTKFKILSIFLCAILLASCQFDESPIDFEPTETIVESPEHVFLIRGTLDGEPFEIKHENLENFNVPHNNCNNSENLVSSFGTDFTIRFPDSGVHNQKRLLFWINFKKSTPIEEVIKVGTYGWNEYNNERFANNVELEYDIKSNPSDYTQWYNSQLSSNHGAPPTAQDDYFEITAVTPLESEGDLSQDLDGVLYKVEGHFKKDIYSLGLDVLKLEVDYFSAIFLDECN